MSNQYTLPIKRLLDKINGFHQKQLTAYIHCSKLNSLCVSVKQIHLLIEWFQTQEENKKQCISLKMMALSQLFNFVEELEELVAQCTKEMCVSFLLSTSVSAPKNEVHALHEKAVQAFRQLEIQRGVDLFSISKDELDLQNLVDMKRITQVLIQISMKGRDDIRARIAARFESLKRLGISISRDDTTDLTVPDLPANLKLVMKHEDIKIGKTIGNGQSGVVQLGTIISTNEEVAVKILHRRALSSPELESYRREIFTLSVLNHENLVCFKGYTEDPPFYIITEYIKNGSLFDVLRSKPECLTPTIKSLIALDIARGIEYLHEKKIIHRDLKSLNILLDENFRAKICDFGMVRTKSQGPMTGMIGTAHWMAPEVLMCAPNYNEKVDVFSYAILLWELLTGDMPYQQLSSTEITLGVIQGSLRPPLPSKGPPKLIQLIQQCWHQDPTKRPTISRVISYLKNPKYHYEGTDEKVFSEASGIAKKKHHHSKINLDDIDYERLISNLHNNTNNSNISINSNDESETDLLSYSLMNDSEISGDDGPPSSQTDKNYEQINDDNITLLCEILNKRSSANKFAKAGGCECLVHIINRGNRETLKIFKKLQKCKSKKIFDEEVFKALLSYATRRHESMRRRALLVLFNAADLRFHYISSKTPFLLSILAFLKKNLKTSTAERVLQLVQKVLSSTNSLPEGVTQFLLQLRHSSSKSPEILPAIDSCLLSCLLFPSAKNEFTPNDLQLLFKDFYGSIMILIHFCDGLDPHPLDTLYGTLLKEIKNTPEKCQFLATMAKNPRFHQILPKMLPLGGELSQISEVYLSLLAFPELMRSLINVPEFYSVASYLIQNGHIPEICSCLKTSPVVSEFLMKSDLCKVIADAFINSKEVAIQIHLMSAIFSTARCTYVQEYTKILPILNDFLFYENQMLQMPAFLCIAVMAFHSSEGINFGNLLNAAAQYVFSESSMLREVAAKLIRAYIGQNGVNLNTVIEIFIQNFKRIDDGIRSATATIYAAAKSRRDVDSANKQKIAQILSQIK
ncbi:TKL family protein kinase [Tritrichomonas foetus]|uniref:TKL family protein kinase n=1 Tax=Tritrichomonas foetus TaxID=1144522 RepID=A0A1J4JYA8_9EUKA|nr:TKL family protein kinase [Tritrichomonas foetus]|eukprot:OHT04143.1 TKL family protein kinase [Tritrichomonas foetus]